MQTSRDPALTHWITQARGFGRVAVIVAEDTRDGTRFPSFVRYQDDIQRTVARLNTTPHTRVVQVEAVP